MRNARREEEEYFAVIFQKKILSYLQNYICSNAIIQMFVIIFNVERLRYQAFQTTEFPGSNTEVCQHNSAKSTCFTCSYFKACLIFLHTLYNFRVKVQGLSIEIWSCKRSWSRNRNRSRRRTYDNKGFSCLFNKEFFFFCCQKGFSKWVF